ncbi:MAG: M56 family metallopeptidase, partial [Saprospiraceae bacterium]|nr:M56 family metallopeptidase [Saprospiraceae bacterium]
MALLFLLKLTLCWGFFALLYLLLLRGETFFRANRAYLLGTAVLGILLSLDVPWLPRWPVEASGLFVLPTFTVGLEQAEAVAQQWLIGDYVWLIYWLGVGFMLLRLGWAIVRLVRMAVRGGAEVLPDGCLLLRSTATSVPFSFFKWVFVPLDFQADSDDQESALDAMLTHERAHANGWHSADVLAMELLCVAFWFHPLVHWYRRALRNVHEYLADAEASRRINLKQYGLLLIRQSQPGMPVALVHHFFQSPLKQRLTMLTKKASAPANALKYGLLIPITLLFVLLFWQAPAIAQAIKDPHLQRIHYLETHNWVETDTLITFDSDTNEESMSVTQTDLSPYKEESTGRQVYHICEQLPTYSGGQNALMLLLANNIHYPPAGKTNKEEGMIIMRFIVAA